MNHINQVNHKNHSLDDYGKDPNPPKDKKH